MFQPIYIKLLKHRLCYVYQKENRNITFCSYIFTFQSAGEISSITNEHSYTPFKRPEIDDGDDEFQIPNNDLKKKALKVKRANVNKVELFMRI